MCVSIWCGRLSALSVANQHLHLRLHLHLHRRQLDCLLACRYASDSSAELCISVCRPSAVEAPGWRAERSLGARLIGELREFITMRRRRAAAAAAVANLRPPPALGQKVWLFGELRLASSGWRAPAGLSVKLDKKAERN